MLGSLAGAMDARRKPLASSMPARQSRAACHRAIACGKFDGEINLQQARHFSSMARSVQHSTRLAGKMSLEPASRSGREWRMVLACASA